MVPIIATLHKHVLTHWRIRGCKDDIFFLKKPVLYIWVHIILLDIFSSKIMYINLKCSMRGILCIVDKAVALK